MRQKVDNRGKKRNTFLAENLQRCIFHTSAKIRKVQGKFMSVSIICINTRLFYNVSKLILYLNKLKKLKQAIAEKNVYKF